MKTDAAVLIDLLAEIRKTVPSDDTATYNALSKFEKKNGEDFSVLSLVSSCCARLQAGIELIPSITDVHKRSFLSAVSTFEGNFALRNMGISIKQFIANISNEIHLQALHFLDFILQSQTSWKSKQIDVDDASELLSSLESFIEKAEIPDYLKSLLLVDIAKIRIVLRNHERFGEQDYWDKFQKLTGLFGAVYTTLDEEAREHGRPLIQRMLHKVVVGVSVGADVAQIIATVAPLLPRT